MQKIQKASAGSGKTFTLAREYLIALLGVKHHNPEVYTLVRVRPDDPDTIYTPGAHSRILAITFTNKATAEMTQRIISELSLLVDPQAKSDHREAILDLFRTGAAVKGQPLPTAHDLARSAKRALRDMLFNFSAFNVMTIDSFFQSVVQNFTRELNLTPDTRLEIDATGPIATTIGQMLDSINRAPASSTPEPDTRFLKTWLGTYMDAQQEEGSRFDIFNRSSGLYSGLLSTMGHMLNETYRLNQTAIDDYLSDPSRIERLWQVLRPGFLRKQKAIIAQQAADILKFPQKSSFNGSKFSIATLEKWSKGIFGNISATVRSASEDPDIVFKKGATSAERALLGPMVKELCQNLVKMSECSDIIKDVGSQLFYLGLFGVFMRQLEAFRRDNQTLLLSDTSSLLHALINEQEAPFIYERLGTKLQHFLVDEFQDTSVMQWENLKPLLINSLAEGHDNLIIGDEKQSIYRFRNAHPELLGSVVAQELRGTFQRRPADPDPVEEHGKTPAENTNWRSSSTVIRFNNQLFALLREKLDAAIGGDSTATATTYANVEQEVAPKHRQQPGFVTAYLQDVSSKEENSAYEEQMLRELTDNIRRQLDHGYRPCDIAILVGVHTSGAKVIAHLMEQFETDPDLRKRKLSIMSDDTLMLGSSTAVQLIVNVLRMLASPQLAIERRQFAEQAELSPAQIKVDAALRREHFILSQQIAASSIDAATGQLTDPSTALKEALERCSRSNLEQLTRDIMQADSLLERLQAMQTPSLMALTERIIEAYLPEPVRTSQRAFIAAFQDLVTDFSQYGEPSVQEFLDFWEEKGSLKRLETAASDNAIKVMTIHKSKGLEFPCVHVPFLEKQLISARKGEFGWFKTDYSLMPEMLKEHIKAEDFPPFIPLTIKGLTPENALPMFAPQVEQLRTAIGIDRFNVLYVALTRAERELSLYGKFKISEKETTISSNAGRMIYDALQLLSADPDSGVKAVSSPEVYDHRFEMGHPTKPETAGKEKEPKWPPVSLTLSATYEAWERPSTELSVKTDIKDGTSFSLDDERQRGIFLHEVLARVRRPCDLPVAMALVAARYNVAPDLQQHYLRLLQQALALPAVAPYFNAFERVAMERDITVPATDKYQDVIVRRADRIVWMPDGSVVVLDYKFGDPETENLDRYKRQVRNYMFLLRAAGVRHLRGLLFFPLHSLTIPVAL